MTLEKRFNLNFNSVFHGCEVGETHVRHGHFSYFNLTQILHGNPEILQSKTVADMRTRCTHTHIQTL